MKKTGLQFIIVRLIIGLTAVCMLGIGFTGCSITDKKDSQNPAATPAESASEIYLDPKFSTDERVTDLVSKMSLEEKAAQMVQGERGAVSTSDLKTYQLGSVLSGGGSVPGSGTLEDWRLLMDDYQEATLTHGLKIPLMYGIDAVHGHSNVAGAVIFPHNIGLGAANDPKLVKEMGTIVAEEMKLTKIIWNFSPCVAIANDPRWGRTYESYSTSPEIVTSLGKAYFEGLHKAGVVATAKHFVADGGVKFGTGIDGNLIDRGDAQLSEAELRESHLKPYNELVKSGVPVVMASFSSFNGEPMHTHKYLLTDVLKTELGFKGFIVSDWEAVNLIKAGKTYKDQIQLVINAGVDMVMAPNDWENAVNAIIKNVNDGTITEQRLNDAVSRILKVKFDAGLFEDPYLSAHQSAVDQLGTDEYKKVAAELVSKSMVLLKNKNNVLPFQKGQKILVIGEGANNIGIQSGGWTMSWQGAADQNGVKTTAGTTILEGLQNASKDAEIEFITDKSRVSEADTILLVVSEIPYAEMKGDTADLSIVGTHGNLGNQSEIDFANNQDKPVVTLIVAGREVMISQFEAQWDSIVMGFLPGSEGQGVAPVLLGQIPFTGRLPMPWYKTVEEIGKEDPELLYPLGYGQ